MLPYHGAESPQNNPYQHSRVGVILDILDENNFVTGKNQSNSQAYFSVKIRWMDRGGEDGNFTGNTNIILLTYPHISRGCGFLFKPSKGDIVACSFRMGGYAVIEGYLPFGYYNKVMGVDEKGYYYRQLIESGEYDLKSKQGAEVYLDKVGSLHLLTRDQEQTSNVTFNNGIEDVKDTVVKDIPQVHIVVGKTFDFKTVGVTKQVDYTKEIKSSAGNSTRLSIQDYTSGAKIIIDSVGNIEITTPSKLTVNATGAVSLNASDKVDIVASGNIKIESSGNVNVNGSVSVNGSNLTVDV